MGNLIRKRAYRSVAPSSVRNMTPAVRHPQLPKGVLYPRFVPHASGLLVPFSLNDGKAADAKLTARRRLMRRLFSGHTANWLSALFTIVALAFAYYSQEARTEADAARIQAEYELLQEQEKSAVLRMHVEQKILKVRRIGTDAEQHRPFLPIG